MAVNGDCANDEEMCEKRGYHRSMFVSDSEMLTTFINDEVSFGLSVPDAVARVMQEIQGGYTLAVMSEDQIIGVRDALGTRPLLLGEIPNYGWVMASEQPALDKSGARLVRDVAAGEMLVMSGGKYESRRPFGDSKEAMCAFEFVYFANEESTYMGENVREVRRNMGRLLAEQLPVEVDYVCGVPKSGLPAAEGYAEVSGTELVMAIGLNQADSDSIFMTPGQTERDAKVNEKYRINRHYIDGKKLLVVDDSIVRGTTHIPMVQMLIDAGATEVHLRLAGPMMSNPCFQGTATRDRHDLLAYKALIALQEDDPEKVVTDAQVVEWIRDFVGVASLDFLTPDNLRKSAGRAGDNLEMACMTGEYLIQIPRRLRVANDLDNQYSLTR